MKRVVAVAVVLLLFLQIFPIYCSEYDVGSESLEFTNSKTRTNTTDTEYNGFFNHDQPYSFNISRGRDLGFVSTIYGEYWEQYFGRALSSGDMNGDGLDDLVVSSGYKSVKDNKKGRVSIFILFGMRNRSLGETNISPTADLVIYGKEWTYDSQAWHSCDVVFCVDVNNDHNDDLLICSNNGLNIFFGSISFGKEKVIDLNKTGPDILIDFTCRSLATGDFDSDGFIDLLLGGGGMNDAMIVFNDAIRTSNGTITKDDPDVFICKGEDSCGHDYFGYMVASGDVNGDGIDDMIISALFGNSNLSGQILSSPTGRVYVVFGDSRDRIIKCFSTSVYPGDHLINESDENVLIVHGKNDYDMLGATVSSCDLDGDGIDDIIMEAVENYVDIIFGNEELKEIRRINLNTSDPDIEITGSAAGYVQDHSDIGDINNDGKDDLFFFTGWGYTGNPYYSPCGSTSILFGRERQQFPKTIDLDEYNGDLFIWGQENDDVLGTDICGWDWDCDGVRNLVISATGGDGIGNDINDTGEVYVFSSDIEPHQKENIPDIQFYEDSNASIDLSKYFDDINGFENLSFVFNYTNEDISFEIEPNGSVICKSAPGYFGITTVRIKCRSIGLDRVSGTHDDKEIISNPFSVIVLSINRPPVVEVISPNGNETIDGLMENRGIYQIQWTAYDPNDDDMTFDILLTTVSYDNYTEVIALNLTSNETHVSNNTFSYTWIVLISSSWPDCKIKIIAHDNNETDPLEGEDESDETFQIFVPPPPLQVILFYPNGGEILNGTVEIRWNAVNWESDTDVIIYIKYSNDSGVSWHNLTEIDTFTESYYWDTTTVHDGNQYRIQIYVKYNWYPEGGVDSSRRSFIIRNNENYEDLDKDGVPDELDAFPNDPSASKDTDNDGMPDEWNPGMGPEDSTSDPPLELDPYPDDPDNIPSDEDKNETVQKEKSDTWIWVSVGVAIVVLIAIFVLTFFRKKKEPPEKKDK